MTAIPPPPAHVEPFVDAIGIDATITFLMHFGGAELYFAATPTGRSRLVDVLGEEAGAALARAAQEAGPRWQRRVPLAKPWIAQVLHAQGLSKAEIARRLHTSDVTVRKYLAAPSRQDPRQSSLF